MVGHVVSGWAKVAHTLGLVWLAVALSATPADVLLTSRPREPQAMFGGHVIALGMPWVAGVVLLCGVAVGCGRCSVRSCSDPHRLGRAVRSSADRMRRAFPAVVLGAISVVVAIPLVPT
jgi:hypothetical protein